MLLLRLLLLTCCVYGCYGDGESVSHLVLLDQLPATISGNSTPELVIRTNFSGKIEFQEAETFKVLLNMTAPSIQEAYAVTSDLVEDKGKLLLQVYQKPMSEPVITLKWIFLLIGCCTGGVLLLTIIYTAWWYSTGQYKYIYDNPNYLGSGYISRSRNSMRLGAAAGELLGDEDHHDDYVRGAPRTAEEEEREKKAELRVALPATIPEETEGDSSEDDRGYGNHYRRGQGSGINRNLSLRLQDRVPSSENTNGSGIIMDYPDQSGDELDDLSPEQKIADADGNYTPLDDIDDVLTENDRSASQKIFVPDPRGNLDINMQSSRSDGELVREYHQKLSERNKIIPPVSVGIVQPARSQNLKVSPRKPADRSPYQRGLNLPTPENDLSKSPVKVMAQVHTPEKIYARGQGYNRGQDYDRGQIYEKGQGQYINLVPTQNQMSRSQGSTDNNDTLDMYTYPSDIPMMTFKGPSVTPTKELQGRPIPKPKPKPKPIFTGGSPVEYGKLEPNFTVLKSTEPISPGNFSMLSEDSSSSDGDRQKDFFDIYDSDLDDPSQGLEGDVVSNASLPLPSPPPMNSEFMPYDTYGAISQLSPRQSLVSPDERGKEYGTMIALTGSPSPGGPFSKHSVNPGRDGNLFVFPPPPSIFNPPQQSAWSRRELFKDENQDGGQPSQMEDRDRSEDQRGGRERRQSGGGKRGGKAGLKHLHLTMISTFCILSLMSGVYCALTSDNTQVNIVVFVPPGFTARNVTIYSALDKELEVDSSFNLKADEQIDWFVAANPILQKKHSQKCRFHSCLHGCDENTGECICRMGYRMEKGTCKDVNECLEGKARCLHPEAGCIDTDGSYICHCSGHLYGDGKQCYECSAPCAKGTYENQPCQNGQGKTCRECTKTCGDNYFMKKKCRPNKDAVCHKCRTRCNSQQGEYEYSQCGEGQDRTCRNKSNLQKPVVSKDIILDDLSNVKDEKVDLIYLPNDFDGARRFLFQRGLTGTGSDFWIEVVVKSLNPTGMFKSVNHSDSLKPSDYPGPPEVLKKYCPYPVPSRYKLDYRVHKDVLYKGNTSQGLHTIEPCQEDESDFLSGRKKKQDQSIFCSEPNIISKVFNIDYDHYTATTTRWLEKSSRGCKEEHQLCENCSGDCARRMTQSSNDCTVSENDDTGRSPRLPLCYKCCLESECFQECRNYHDFRCQLTRCQNGTLVQFSLESVYPSSNDFYCHVEQVLDQTLIELEYKVKYHYNTILHSNFSIHSDKIWQQTGHVFKRDKIISVEIDGKLDEVPNIIQWAIGAPNIRVGTYKSDGTDIKTILLDTKSTFIRPRKPFGISPRKFGEKNCHDDLLEDVVFSRELEDPYRIMSDLLAKEIMGPDGKYMYFISNKRQAPIVHIEINKDTSILGAIFNETRLLFDTLTGNMSYNSTHWVLNVTGKIEKCPGFLQLNVTDPKYPDLALYQFDVGVLCPKEYTKSDMSSFSFEFAIPTADEEGVSKDLQVHIRDKSATYHLTVHGSTWKQTQSLEDMFDVTALPVPQQQSDIDSGSSVQQEEPPHFSLLFVVTVLGAILILLLLLMFGVAWKQGVPEGPILRFQVLHLFLLCSYITFQFLYSLFVSMTVFVLVIIAVNGERTAFLQQYNQQSSVKTALSQLELDQMESHLMSEIHRQNAVAQSRKTECEAKMKYVVEDLKMLKESLENSSVDRIKKQNASHLITSHTRTVLNQFSSNLITFRDQYSQFVDYILHKLIAEVGSTNNSIVNSTWLRGAKYLHGNIVLIRQYFGSGTTTIPFMKWVNMDTDLTRLAEGLTLPLPDLPILQEELPASMQTPGGSTGSAHAPKPLATETSSVWFIQPQFNAEQVPNQGDKQKKRKEKHVELKLQEYMTFFIAMVCIDVLWLLHRMIKAVGIGKLLLYGYPIYVDVREKKDDLPVNEGQKTKRPFLQICKDVMTKMLSTFFLPKLIGTVFVCLVVYLISFSAFKFINRKTFNYLGYYNDMEDLMRLNGAVINSRLNAHASRINAMELPVYESMMNAHVQLHQEFLNLAEVQWNSINQAHADAYCTYLRRINVTASCHDNQGQGHPEIQVEGCRFTPIAPVPYNRNISASSKIAAEQLDDFLINIQKLVSNTCEVILIYLALIIIKELLSTVLWIFIKRSGIVSLRIIYETDEIPGTADNSTTNK